VVGRNLTDGDEDVCAEGEAELGWLNAELELKAAANSSENAGSRTRGP